MLFSIIMVAIIVWLIWYFLDTASSCGCCSGCFWIIILALIVGALMQVV